MNKMFKLLLMFGVMLIPAFLFAEPLAYSEAEGKVSNVVNIVIMLAKAGGVAVIIWGIVELLVEKDQGGQQGKKASGALKIVGGICLVLIGSVIGWTTGTEAVDSNGNYKVKD